MKVIKNCIEYYGIVDYIPCDVLGFKDFIIEKTIELTGKPKINYFTKSNVEALISKTEIVNSEKDYESYKINIEGSLKSRVEYISLEQNNLICTDRKKFDFDFDIDILEKFNVYKKLITNIYIEDIYLKKITDEKYIMSFSILVIVEE